MITLSGFRPVSPVQASVAHTQRPPAVRFGWDDDDYYYSNSMYADLDPRAEFWSGFVPGETVKSTFGVAANSLSQVIDSQSEFERLWKATGMPDYDRPAVDFKTRAVILIAVERKSGTSAIPFQMRYNKRWDDLDVYIPTETDKSRNPGTAWYIGVVSTCAGDDSKKPRGTVYKSITRSTRVSSRQTRDF